MREQEYVLENVDSFEVKDIFECGQCFRWEKEDDKSYTGIVSGNIINVKVLNEDNDILFSGIKRTDVDIEKFIIKYFDLERDYNKIKEEFSKSDNNLKKAITYCGGIRILNQDLWEMVISYIISANNNIPRIKKIINALSEKYGKEINYNGKKYYSFPEIEDLKKVSIEEYRKCGAGFRDKYLYNTVKKILSEKNYLSDLYKLDTKTCKDKLLELDGVGPKVCDCILLFSDLKRFDCFPVDVWVRRVMNDLYIKNVDEKKVTNSEIQKIADEKFGDNKGLAQQYLFMWRRNNKEA